MKFYAVQLTSEGKEPLRTENRLLFELHSIKEAIQKAHKCFKNNFKLYLYQNLYNDRTYTEII